MLDSRTIKYVRVPVPSEERYGSEWEWLSPRFARLYRSWWLQGETLKGDVSEYGPSLRGQSWKYPKNRSWWKEIIGESAQLFTDTFKKTNQDMIDSLTLIGFLGSLSSTHAVTCQKAKELMCDVFACQLTLEEDYRRVPQLAPLCLAENTPYRDLPIPLGTYKWAPCDFVFLATCFIGDLDAVRSSLDLSGQMQRSADDVTLLRFAGLYVAVRRDHRELISFLLISGLEFSDEQWLCVLWTAAQTGNYSTLHFFLRPEYSAQRRTKHLCYVLVRATEYTDTFMRIEMCKLLLPFLHELTPQLRTRMLVAACRSNDTVFADWIIGTRPANLYEERLTGGPFKQHPLFIAVNHDSTEIIQFLLSRSDLEGSENAKQRIIEVIFQRAIYLGRLDPFVALLSYQSQLNPGQILASATAVDHALDAIGERMDLTGADASETSGLVEKAIAYQFITNLEWLLKHDFRTKVAVNFQLDCKEYTWERQPKFKSTRAIFDDLRRIEDLLRVYNNPGIKLKCSSPCKARKSLSEVLQLPEPWEYNCVCERLRCGHVLAEIGVPRSCLVEEEVMES